jgi:hypothetical protein
VHESAAGESTAHESTGLGQLREAARSVGLTVRAHAHWPETDADERPTPVAGFIESSFNPLVAEVAGRALERRPQPLAEGCVTAVVLATTLGDVTSALRVAEAVDGARRVAPLLFFQSVPNAVAGHIAARWRLTGPVVCVGAIGTALDVAADLIDDADADEALIVYVDVAASSGRDRAAAVLVTRPADGKGPA